MVPRRGSNTRLIILLAIAICVTWNTRDIVDAFSAVPSPPLTKATKSDIRGISQLSVAIGGDDLVMEESAALSSEEMNPIFKLNKGSEEKIVNAFGLWTILVTMITSPLWLLAMKIVDAVNDDPHREMYDGTGKVWSKAWLTLSNCYPTITGDLSQIDKERGACLYVANHASWLDIPIVCTVLHPVFKFIAKGDLKNIPCIGDQLSGGKHILIDREDRRSQLRTFKESIGWLNKGVPLMAFPEGQRSKDGRLMKFKGGTFSMALKSKVPIVPITISNAHAIMPSNALFPVQSGVDKLRVHVHPAIDVEGRTEEELSELVRAAIISKLPMDQRPLPDTEDLVLDDGREKSSGNLKELQKS